MLVTNPTHMKEGEGQLNELYSKLVEELDMSVRTADVLGRIGVSTIGDLVRNCTARRLREAVDEPTHADKVVDEVREILMEFGFTLKDE